VTVLALDIGTSSVRAQRFDQHGEPDGELRQEEYETDDPAEVAAAVRSVLGAEEPDATSCFAHSLLAVADDWSPLTPILGWRDTRSAGAAEWLARRLEAGAIHARTGAFLHSSFWPAKLAWLAEREPETFRGAAWFVSFADYLRGKPPDLPAAHGRLGRPRLQPETSLGMASTSGLLDLTTLDWDEELLATLGIDRERLPRIADVPLWSDAACSNAGAGCTGRERAALMVGTSGALRVLYETETPYQYARVVEQEDGDRLLELNEGQAIHSLWRADTVLTGGYWDGFLTMPFATGSGRPPARIATSCWQAGRSGRVGALRGCAG
jgi:gluconokinase